MKNIFTALLLLAVIGLNAQKTASTKAAKPAAFGEWKNLNTKLQNAGFGREFECIEGRQTVCTSRVIEMGQPPKPGERRNGIMVTYEKQSDIDLQTITIGLFLSNMNEKDMACDKLVEMSQKLFKELKITYPTGLEEAIKKLAPYEIIDLKKDLKIALIPRKSKGKVRQLFLEIYSN